MCDPVLSMRYSIRGVYYVPFIKFVKKKCRYLGLMSIPDTECGALAYMCLMS